MTGQYDRQDQADKLTAANIARQAADPFATIPAAEAGFTCIYCGKSARTTQERNCASPESPDARHHAEAPAAPADLVVSDWAPEADPEAVEPVVCGAEISSGICMRLPHPAEYPHIAQAKYAAQADADMPNPAPARVDLFRAEWPYSVVTAAELSAMYAAAAETIKARGYNPEEVRGFDGEPGISITGALRGAALDHVMAADPGDTHDQHVRAAHDLTEELETRLSAVLYLFGQVHTRTGISDLSDIHVGWSLAHFDIGPTPGLAAAVELLGQAARLFASLEHVTEAPAPVRF